MTYLTSEIYKKALALAQAQNADLDWNDAITIINSAYSILYSTLAAQSDNLTIQETEISFPYQLPKDCYKIALVYVQTDQYNMRELIQAPIDTKLGSSNFHLVNDTLYAIHSSLVLHYIPVPVTLTFPNSKIKLLDDLKTGLYDNGWVAYSNDYETALIDLENEVTSRSFTLYSKLMFCKNKLYGLRDSTLYKLDSDLTEEFVASATDAYVDLYDEKLWWYYDNQWTDGEITRENKAWLWEDNEEYLELTELNGMPLLDGDALFEETPDSFVVAYPYVFANYKRKTLVYNAGQTYEQNWKQLSGYIKRNTILNLSINDATGYGLITTTSLESFVPDTLLEYSTPVFFDVLILRVAVLILSWLGLTPGPQLLYASAVESSFFANVRKNLSSSKRIKNLRYNLRR